MTVFVANSIYSRSVKFVPGNDMDVFKCALDLAVGRVNPDASKDMCPVVFCSSLSKMTDAERGTVPRRLMSSDRARRKFVVFDVDFDAGQERELDALLGRFRGFADEFNTPILVYPTLSYPVKPRVRVVFFTKRPMTAFNYGKAVVWIAGRAGYVLTDRGDLRMTANRNLPFFSSGEQVEGVFSTIGVDGLEPLDNGLWRNVRGVKVGRRKPGSGGSGVEHGSAGGCFDTVALGNAVRDYVRANGCDSYDKVWQLVDSIGFEMFSGTIDKSAGELLMKRVADVVPESDPRHVRWSVGNLGLLNKSLSAFRDGSRDVAMVKPLLSFGVGFVAAFTPGE